MKKRLSVLLLTAVLVLSACGSSDSAEAVALGNNAKSAGSYAAYDDMYSAAEAYVEEEYEEMPASKSEQVEVNDTSRKLIKNVDISAETNDMDAMINNIQNRVDACGGYVEYSYSDNGGYYNSNYSRHADYTIRIPAKNLDAFLENVAEISNIIYKNVNVTDVTLQYVDVEARKSSLETEQSRLLELMEKAETVEDIITIETRLSDIRYELESAERQIRSYDNQVDYSTVTLSISEVKEYTPVEEPSRLEKMTGGFVDSLKGVGNGFLDFFTGLVIALPYLVVWAAIILAIVFIIRAIIKKSKKKRIAKAAMAQPVARPVAQPAQPVSQAAPQTQTTAQAQTEPKA